MEKKKYFIRPSTITHTPARGGLLLVIQIRGDIKTHRQQLGDAGRSNWSGKTRNKLLLARSVCERRIAFFFCF
jgi:hypothetical protein